jgi:hypothetical protein
VRSLRVHSVSSNGIYPNVFLNADGLINVPAGIGPQPGTILATDLQRFRNLYNHLLGRISRTEQIFYSDLSTFNAPGIPRERNFRAPEAHGFFQDDWRLRPNLVLNLGFVTSCMAPADASVAERLRRAPARRPVGSRVPAAVESDRNNFAPRAGLVWDPDGRGKTAIRASYGIYHDPMIGNVLVFVDDRTPGFASTQTVFPNSQPGLDRRLSDGSWPSRLRTAARPARSAGRLPRFSIRGCAPSAAVQRLIAAPGFGRHGCGGGWVGNRGIKLATRPCLTSGDQRRFLEAFRAAGLPRTGSSALVRQYARAAFRLATGCDCMISPTSRPGTGRRGDRYRRPVELLAVSWRGIAVYSTTQFNQLFIGTNDGRSYYDSLQQACGRRRGSTSTIRLVKSICSPNSGAAVEG